MLKNITLSAEDELIRKAREKARHEHTTLNEAFRHWLRYYANWNFKARGYDTLMDSLKYVRSGGHFTRDELNER